MKQCYLLFVFSLSVSLLGCGGGGGSGKQLPTVPVSGKLMVDGKPTGNCSIIFTPLTDDSDPDKLLRKTASASVAADGSFTLRTYKDGDGAIPGKYTVTIASDPANSVDMKPVPGVFAGDVEIKKDSSPLEVALKGNGSTVTGVGNPSSGVTPP